MKPPKKKARSIEQILCDLKNNSKIDNFTGCWLYQGSFNDKDDKHCKIRFQGKKVYIHRLSAFIHWNFNLNSLILILHKTNCPNKNCWNPEHLYEGTHRDNTLDTIKIGTYSKHQLIRTHCNYGHPLDGIYSSGVNKGKRYCLTCNRERSKNNRILSHYD